MGAHLRQQKYDVTFVSSCFFVGFYFLCCSFYCIQVRLDSITYSIYICIYDIYICTTSYSSISAIRTQNEIYYLHVDICNFQFLLYQCMVCHQLSLPWRLILFEFVVHNDYVYCYRCSFRQGRKNPNRSSSIQSNCHSNQYNYHNLHNTPSHQSSLCHNKQVMRNDYFPSNHPILRFHIQVLFEDLMQIFCKIDFTFEQLKTNNIS